MSRLDQAIKDFEDETLNFSLGERLSRLRDALTYAAYERIKVINKFGTRVIDADEGEYKLKECLKQYKIMEGLYKEQVKQNKELGKAKDEGMGSDWLRRVKESNPLGSIVRNMNEKTA